jgi:hypothetical protein
MGAYDLYIEVTNPDVEPSDGLLFGVFPPSLPSEGPTPWFIPSGDSGGDYPPFCGTPPGPGGGQVLMPSLDTPPGHNDPLDCW